MTRWRIETTDGRVFFVYAGSYIGAAALFTEPGAAFTVTKAGRWHRGRLELPEDEAVTTQGRDT